MTQPTQSNTLLEPIVRDLDLAEPNVPDTGRLEVVADGLLLFSGPVGQPHSMPNGEAKCPCEWCSPVEETNFGQSNFGQSISGSGVSWLAGPNPEISDPEGWGPEGWAGRPKTSGFSARGILVVFV